MFSTEPVTRRHYLRTALTMSAAVGALLSCSDSTSPDKSGTFFGPTIAMGSGTASTRSPSPASCRVRRRTATSQPEPRRPILIRCVGAALVRKR